MSEGVGGCADVQCGVSPATPVCVCVCVFKTQQARTTAALTTVKGTTNKEAGAWTLCTPKRSARKPGVVFLYAVSVVVPIG